MTPDAAAAQGFYSKVLGWKTQAWELDASYTLFVANSGPIGGTSSETGPSQWISYIGTDDIEATVRQAQELGGIVTKPITSMPNGGRYALLDDPQGATFGVYESTSDHAPEKAAKRGEHSWHELATDDYQAAFDFYSALFGWEEAGQHDMGAPNGVYFMFGRNGVTLGGIFNRLPEMPASAWTAYVRVRDTQKVVPKATAEGATLLVGPMEVPGGDWIAQFADPQGAVFAVHTVLADVKGAPAPQAANEESVTPDDAGAQRHEDAVSSATATAKQPAKRSAKAASKAAVKPAKKKPAVKAAKPAAKRAKPAKTAQKTTKTAAKKSSKKKAGKKKASKKKSASPVAKQASKQRRSAQAKSSRAKSSKSKSSKAKSTRKSAPRKSVKTAKRSAGKSKKAKRPIARRPAKKAAKRARRAK
jgi:predicted enzyme related to lactoylglutathione lyase